MSMNTLLRTNTIIILILIITVKLHKEDCPEGPIGICTDPSRPPSESTWRARVGLLIAWPGFRGRCGGIGPQGFRGRCGGIREFTWLAHSHSCCLRQHAFTSLAYSRSCCLRQHAFTALAYSRSCCLRQPGFTSLAHSHSCCLRQPGFTSLAHSHSCCLRQHGTRHTALAYSRSCCLRQHAKDSEGGPEGCSTK